MITEIVDRYKGFHDSVIFDISYNTNLKSGNKTKAYVTIQAFNNQDEKWEKIQLIFKEVVKFRFFESTKIGSTVIFETYVDNVDGTIVFDFFALQVDGRDKLAEDRNSTFVIHCKEIEYVVLDHLITPPPSPPSH